MRRVLILGGTAWLGREIAGALLDHGDAVTCLARGESGQVPAGASLLRSDRLLPDAYAAVEGQPWDEVIELGYEATLVSGALEAIGPTAAHWTLISSVSVYAGDSTPDADESAALVESVGAEDYAGAKAAAERMSTDALADRLLIVRPGLLAGPGDASDRFGYWPARFALAGSGPVLVPECEGRWVQVLEAADLASWLVAAGAEGLTGVLNATGDRNSLREVLDQAADAAGLMVSWSALRRAGCWRRMCATGPGPGRFPCGCLVWTPGLPSGTMLPSTPPAVKSRRSATPWTGWSEMNGSAGWTGRADPGSRGERNLSCWGSSPLSSRAACVESRRLRC